MHDDTRQSGSKAAQPRDSKAELARELEDARTLQAISTLLIEDSDDRLFDEILNAAMRIMRSDFASMQLLDAEKNVLRLVANKNFHPDAARFWQTVTVETGTTCGIAFERGQRLVVPDVRDADIFRESENQEYWRKSGIVAVQSTPLVSRNRRLIGMISTHWREVHTPGERELLLFDVLAGQAADFIERRRAEAELRRSERHAQMLLAELQHRVRNSLAVVRSIARKTAENSTSVSDMLAHFQGRLDAFSRVQSALTRSPDGKVDLATIIEDELIAHAARDGEQVRIEGPSIAMDSRTAERMSLAIHELTTNAVKHGALMNGGGRIRIRWKAPNGGDRLVLKWEETGVKLRSRSIRREGFGMELLRRSLPYDLDADTKVELRPEKGLLFQLDMPLSPPPASMTRVK